MLIKKYNSYFIIFTSTNYLNLENQNRYNIVTRCGMSDNETTLHPSYNLKLYSVSQSICRPTYFPVYFFTFRSF